MQRSRNHAALFRYPSVSRKVIFVLRRKIRCCETDKDTHMGGHKDLDFITITWI